jgi:DNA-binding LytR/AlgR family response regulator
VDDEPVARRVLREQLEGLAGVQIVGEADTGASALVQIAQLAPNLVFLDLQMPGMGGLEVIRNIRHSPHLPVFVIVTAYDSYAIQAFEAGAVDYLLKPVRAERLRSAVARARRVTAPQAAEKLAHLQTILDVPATNKSRKIVGRKDREFYLLRPEEILAFQAEADIVWIVTARERYEAEVTLKELEENLLHSGFQRIHRGALVNVEHVRKMSVLSSQRWLITLSNNQELIASKRLVRGLRNLLRS